MESNLKITTLIENETTDERLIAEHGLSMLFEVDGKSFLFDTGGSDAILRNAEMLGIELGKLDGIIISHGHYDHTLGLMPILEKSDGTLPVYIHSDGLNEKYKKDGDQFSYNGLPFKKEELLKKSDSVHLIYNDITQISESVFLVTNFLRWSTYEKNEPKYWVKKNDTFQVDDFTDEIAVVILGEEGLVVLVGCSHPGIMNILNHIHFALDQRIQAVLGGTHLMNADSERIKATCHLFRELGISSVCSSHCSGKEATAWFKEQLGERFKIQSTGTVFDFI